MANMGRRRFLLTLAAAGTAALGSASGGMDTAVDAVLPVGQGTPRASAKSVGGPAPTSGSAPGGVIYRLPGNGNQLAWTVDDGCSTAVVASFAKFLKDTGIRMTFFVNGANPSWTVCAPALRPMVESGQVLLGNHTWSHPFITKLAEKDVAAQINRNEQFLKSTYGVSGKPFFRPPYGSRNPTTDRIAADNGYRTITMWTGTLGDSTAVGANSPDRLTAAAQREFAAQHIVLSHANLPGITRCYPQMAEIIKERKLRTVTLKDVYGS